jgi:hypothetical protein
VMCASWPILPVLTVVKGMVTIVTGIYILP